jgi:hypothetical protein
MQPAHRINIACTDSDAVLYKMSNSLCDSPKVVGSCLLLRWSPTWQQSLVCSRVMDGDPSRASKELLQKQ